MNWRQWLSGVYFAFAVFSLGNEEWWRVPACMFFCCFFLITGWQRAPGGQHPEERGP